MSKILTMITAGALLAASSALAMAQTNDAAKPSTGKTLGGGGESSSGGSGPGAVQSEGQPAGSADSGSGTTTTRPTGGATTGSSTSTGAAPGENASPAKTAPQRGGTTPDRN